MKKILVSLTLVGLITLLSLASMAFTPAKGTTRFEAGGFLFFDPTNLEVTGFTATPRGLVLRITGERHVGAVFSQDWPTIDGAQLSINVNHEQAVFLNGLLDFGFDFGFQTPCQGKDDGLLTFKQIMQDIFFDF